MTEVVFVFFLWLLPSPVIRSSSTVRHSLAIDSIGSEGEEEVYRSIQAVLSDIFVFLFSFTY